MINISDDYVFISIIKYEKIKEKEKKLKLFTSVVWIDSEFFMDDENVDVFIVELNDDCWKDEEENDWFWFGLETEGAVDRVYKENEEVLLIILLLHWFFFLIVFLVVVAVDDNNACEVNFEVVLKEREETEDETGEEEEEDESVACRWCCPRVVQQEWEVLNDIFFFNVKRRVVFFLYFLTRWHKFQKKIK